MQEAPTSQTRRRTLATLCAGAMGVTAAAGVWLRPKHHLSSELGPIRLAESIPRRFGQWEQNASQVNIVNPQQSILLEKLYADLLTRNYKNNAEHSLIMLSVAYGADQGDKFQVHYPEVCYPAQGFEIKSNNSGIILTPYGEIHITRLVARLESRIESISYWAMVGQKQSTKGIIKKMNEIKYNLSGTIPDGLIFRISSIGQNTEIEFNKQVYFINDLLMYLNPIIRRRVAGV